MFCCEDCAPGECLLEFACSVACVAFEQQHELYGAGCKCQVNYLDAAVEIHRRLRDVPNRDNFFDLIPHLASLPEDLSEEFLRIIRSIVLRLDPERAKERYRWGVQKLARERRKLKKIAQHSSPLPQPQ